MTPADRPPRGTGDDGTEQDLLRGLMNEVQRGRPGGTPPRPPIPLSAGNAPAARTPPPVQPAEPVPASPLLCPVCREIPATEVKVEVIRPFDGNGMRRDSLYDDISGTEEADRVVRLSASGQPSNEHVITHVTCASVLGDNSTMVLVGLAAAGKSHLLAGLIESVSQGRAGDRVGVIAPRSDVRTRLAEHAQRVYTDRLTLKSTTIGQRSDQRPYELTFETVVDGLSRSRRVTLHDVAGEVSGGDDNTQAFLGFAGAADYFIFCLDPAQTPGLADSLGFEKPSGWLDSMIRGFADMVRKQKGMATVGDEIEPAPVAAAVVITKADMLLVNADAKWEVILDRELRIFGERAGFTSWREWSDRMRDHSQLVQDYLVEVGGPAGRGLVNRFNSSFARVSYHLASPLGGPVKPAERTVDSQTDNLTEVDEHTSLFTFTPTDYTLAGVIEPFARGFGAIIGCDPMMELEPGRPVPW